MRVLVCDDDDRFREIILQYLNEIAIEQNLRLDIQEFYKLEALLDQVKKESEIQLIFLDIIFQEEQDNGLKIAEEIQKINPRIKIVFITNYDSFAVQGYQVNAIGYLVKPIEYTEFKIQFQKYLSKIREEERYICIKAECNYAMIQYSELIYVDTMERNIRIHTVYHTYKVRHTMKELEDILKVDSRFFRSHTSYIVNIEYILFINGLEILLKNGERILLSKYKKKKIMQKMLEYSRNSRWL